MSYSQKPLIDLIKSGNFHNETTVPKHIETVISNVFVFDKMVYKLYKNNNPFFNEKFRNISKKEDRFTFTKRDFEWNNTLSPSVYLKVIGVIVKNEEIKICAPDNAEEIVIVMNRIDTNEVLYEKLLKGEVSEGVAYLIGKQFGESVRKIQKPIKGNYYDDFLVRITDLREWFKSTSEEISLEESTSYCDFLASFLEKNRSLFENELTAGMTYDGDIHSHNAIFSNEHLYLIDTFPPKEEWMRGHPHISLYRMGSDLYALSGKKEMFDAYMNGYVDSGGSLNRELDNFYIIYASGIMLPYQYMLAKNDPHHKKGADLFHKFIREHFKTHCQ